MLTDDIYTSPDDILMDEDFLDLDSDSMLDFDDYDLPSMALTPSPTTSQTLVDEGDSSEQEDEESDTEENDAVPALEEIIANCLESLLDVLPESSPKKDPAKAASINIELANRTMVSKEGGLTTKVVSFPQNTRKGRSSTFAQVLRIVDLMHEALHDDLPITKRDMYYRDVALFKKQSVVDKHVDDIAATIGVSRGDLNVRASSKGLFCGSGLTIHLSSGEILCGNDTEGTLIPVADEIERFDMREGLTWVLVVEKEAVFQTLVRLQFSTYHSLPGWGIIITGKGYPDVATRQLVCTLADNLHESVPIIALVDADAYGLDIVSVYKYGSRSMAHERETLIAPRLQWAGIMGSELAQFGVDKDSLLPITKYDEKKAHTLLCRPNLPPAWKRELQHMLFSRRKAEIEILANSRCSKDVSSSVPENGMSILSSSFKGTPEIPLIRYLVHKVTTAITQSRSSEHDQ
ncbi:hypothetical protein QCA50_004300 [Cerrena zonata]|uniref:DNA topoisomerase (ATP-hydrolyzing) n=1 Tax=Cerrena zonata TaxID=2478898 RepID=A0AAW0GRS6_9APHY